jgi:GT2 family glycosyltransferase
MARNYILRPVYNRPEMLQLSLEFEDAARHYKAGFAGFDDLETIFIIEYGTPKKTLKLLEDYPFNAKFIERKKRFGLTPNILEGMKATFDLTANYVIYIEDDVLLHETYFEYLYRAINHQDLEKFSVISPYQKND